MIEEGENLPYVSPTVSVVDCVAEQGFINTIGLGGVSPVEGIPTNEWGDATDELDVF